MLEQPSIVQQPSNFTEVAVQPPQLEVTENGVELVFTLDKPTLYKLLAETAKNEGTQKVADSLPN